MLGDGQPPGLDMTVVVPVVSLGHQLVQGDQGRNVGDRDQVTPAERPTSPSTPPFS